MERHFWLLLFLFVQLSSSAQTTYYAVKSGNWANVDDPIWSATPGGSPTLNGPNNPSAHVVIPSGMTVELNVSGREMASLTIAAGGTLNRTGTIQYIDPHGDLIVDGEITGNVGLSPHSGTVRVYSEGNGSATFGRIRKGGGGPSMLTIDMDVTIAYSGATAALTNQAGGVVASGPLTVVINAGRTPTVTAGDVSLDGVDGTNSSESTGSLQIFGTLDIQDGDLWLTSDNDAGNDLSYTVESGGLLRLNGDLIGNDVPDMNGSAAAQVTFSVAAGGELRLLAPGAGWRDLTGRNTVELAPGSRVVYAGGDAQTIYPDWTYPELAIANPSTRLAGPTTVAEALVFESGGRLALGDYDLEVEGALDGGADGFVVTDGAGQLRVGMEDFAITTFPLGSNAAEYLPLTIERADNGAWPGEPAAPKSAIAWLGLSVGNFAPSGLQPAASIVARRWMVNLISGDGSGFHITPGWTSIQQQSNFTPGNCYVSWRQDSDPWTGDTPAPASGPVSGYYARTRGPVTLGGVFNEFVPASNGALPVTLLDFSAKAAERSVRLTWHTSAETDNDYFAIERSADGRAFDEVGRLRGMGTSQESTPYVFSDPKPLPGRSYYRLRQVDFDGTTEYFGPIAVYFSGADRDRIKLYPTPATDRVILEGVLAAGTDLSLFDASGHLLRSWRLAEATGRRELPLVDLPPGVYLLRATMDGTVITLRVVKG